MGGPRRSASDRRDAAAGAVGAVQLERFAVEAVEEAIPLEPEGEQGLIEGCVRGQGPDEGEVEIKIDEGSSIIHAVRSEARAVLH